MSGDVSFGSAFGFPGRTPTDIKFKLAGTSPVAVAGSSTATVLVVWFQCTEVAGGTGNLTIDIYDGTNAYLLHPLQAMTAKQELFYGRGFLLNPGSFLRVTQGTDATVHVLGLATIPTQQQ